MADKQRSSAANAAKTGAGSRPAFRSQELLAELGRRIVSQNYPPGSTLPTEAEISREFEVGRNVVREAIKILVGKQLIRTSRRAGTIVRPRVEWNLFDPDVAAWRLHDPSERDVLIKEMTEFRNMIEPVVAVAAAQRATTTQILRVFEAYERMEAANDAASAVRADMEFHRRVFEATNNALLISLSNLMSIRLSLNLELAEDPALRSRMMDAHTATLGEHLEMAEAIRQRDVNAARAVTEGMLGHARAITEPVLAPAAE